MEELFVLESEFNNFRYRHPEYNEFELVYNKYGEPAGYVARVNEEHKDEKIIKGKK